MPIPGRHLVPGGARPLVLALAATVLAACPHPAERPAPPAPRDLPASPVVEAPTTPCPSTARAPAPLPGVRPEHRTLAYWLAQATKQGSLDEVLLTRADLAAHNRAVHHRDDLEFSGAALLEAPVPEKILARVNARLKWARQGLADGRFVDAENQKLPDATQKLLAPVAKLGPLRPTLRVALDLVPIRCSPLLRGFYRAPADKAFDRNRCSTARPQEPLQVLRQWPGGSLLVRTQSVVGWIAGDAPLSPAVPRALRRRLLGGPRQVARDELNLRAPDGTEATIPKATLLVPARRGRVHFATAAGWHVSEPVDPSLTESTARPLTRRAVLTEAFRALDVPYGWGGHGGGHDCSSYLIQLFSTFGLDLPRNSSQQARAGTYAIDIPADASDQERLLLLDAAARSGITLLYLPGHIMLYLGRTTEGLPMVIHALAEYLEPCPGPARRDTPPRETTMQVGRIDVSGLELGRGTSRRSFLRRVTRVVILTATLQPELQGVAQPRAAAPVVPRRGCRGAGGLTLFISPVVPHRGQPLRIIASSSRPLGPLEMLLVDPKGTPHRPALHRLGGPPFGYWASVPTPQVGRWTALLGDGDRLEACRRITVRRGPPRLARGDGPVWKPRRRWGAYYSRLYSLFVEQLFDYPITEDRTWPSLQVLLANQEQNLLWNHLGNQEDAELNLKPDCADLPHFLRAYFAWKLKLPVALRRCTRGGSGRPPACGPVEVTNLRPRIEEDPLDDVRTFIGRDIAGAVHSGSGRTHPEDDETDYYPIPLTREALRPGVVFADPYGHVLVVAKWIPQGLGQPGILVGADAQPDATVGRRRFWRGTFLFRPETTEAGAGFKDFRPLRYESRDEDLVPLTNDDLRRSRSFTRYSAEQNKLSVADFYDRLDTLINPRPLDPDTRMMLLVDALDEAVRRRVTSVANGERYVKEHPGTIIPMPSGHSIFETTGPWENYSTPSRDMRLLIAMDTVLEFPRQVQRRPAHFGIAADAVAKELAALEGRLREALKAKRLSYTRSDGTPQPLTLADVVDRAQALEVAYNPNDCIEIRWGARDGTPEHATCRRRAPEEQQARMREYRAWFRDRRRPSR